MNSCHLFAGIGGDMLGAQRAGLTPISACENDPSCCKILTRHFFPVEPADVRTFKAPRGLFLLTSGSPCQDISLMRATWGDRKGIKGNRSSLVWETVRIIEESRPRFAVLENTLGLLSSNKGEDFTAILEVLAEVGYVGSWRCVDAAAFGTACRREHLFILAEDSRRPGYVPGRDWLSHSDNRNPSGRELRKGSGSTRATDGRPARDVDYRLLTPEECEASLGFPAGWTSGSGATNRYHQLGNTCSPVASEWLCRRLLGEQ